jgi:hypothetical protein
MPAPSSMRRHERIHRTYTQKAELSSPLWAGVDVHSRLLLQRTRIAFVIRSVLVFRSTTLLRGSPADSRAPYHTADSVPPG